MTPETKDDKQWSARKWGWMLVLLFAITQGLFTWSLGDFLTNQVTFFYQLDSVVSY
jgi:hypothetical protein